MPNRAAELATDAHHLASPSSHHARASGDVSSTVQRARSRGGFLASLSLLLLDACDGPRADFERMLDQHKYEAYEASAFFADGRVMRPPPPGSVPRGAVVDPELRSGLRNGAPLRELPVAASVELLQRGRNRFEIFCAACHGPLGNGQSGVSENMRWRPPPSLHDAAIRARPAGYLYRVINEGYGLMPAYASELDVPDRWAVVGYVQALQLSQNLSLTSLPTPLREEARPWLR
jgi:mono/diheme cytochrome c family protein